MKVIEFFKDFDLFSESVQFNDSRRRLRKRTVAGAFLTISILVSTIIYFIYQSYLYFSGQMDPKFRQQTFVSNDIQLQINNEIFGFDFFSLQSGQYLSQRQEQQNKTYIVYVAFFVSVNGSNSSRIPLDIIKCQSEELKGMNCFDFSKLPHQQLFLKDRQTIFSFIDLYTYRCQDIDKYKSFVPNNCAEEKLIDKFLSSEPYKLMVRMQVSQFNVTSEMIESQYKFTNLLSQINTVFTSQFKLQKQISKIQSGFIVQSELKFSSPISSSVTSQSISRQQLIEGTGYMFLGQIYFMLDESVTYFNIQFPIFTEVLALCNSTLTLLLLLGSFCRKLAQKFIRRDIFFILMKDFYSELNKMTNLNNQTKQKQINQEDQVVSDEESKKIIFMPHLEVKSSIKVLQQQYTKQSENTEQDYVKEDIKAQIRQQEELIESLRIGDSKLSKIQTNLNKQQELSIISNLNKYGQNENDLELVPSLLSNKSPKQQLQLFPNNQSSSSFSRSLKSQPEFQKRNNRIKRRDQQISIETENDKKNIQNSSQKIDQNFNNLNDKSLQYKLEQILFKSVQIIVEFVAFLYSIQKYKFMDNYFIKQNKQTFQEKRLFTIKRNEIIDNQ